MLGAVKNCNYNPKIYSSKDLPEQVSKTSCMRVCQNFVIIKFMLCVHIKSYQCMWVSQNKIWGAFSAMHAKMLHLL